MAETGTRLRWWGAACSELAARDPLFMPLIATHPQMRLGARGGDAFQTLARSVIGQQISVQAAQAVWARLVLQCGEVTPSIVLAMDPAALRSCGLSGRKVEYVGDLARHFLARPLALGAWSTLDDAAIVAELTAVRGIGVWTAQMFLIFHLARPDVLPLADLGLRRAIELRYSRARPTSARRVAQLSALWKPWRTVATWYLWRSLQADPVIHE